MTPPICRARDALESRAAKLADHTGLVTYSTCGK
jgi:hypothetical protein